MPGKLCKISFLEELYMKKWDQVLRFHITFSLIEIRDYIINNGIILKLHFISYIAGIKN